MSKAIKYALYKYSTTNIGDQLQSIAARRFLPQVDYYIDRDYVGEWKNPNQDEEVKLIANGWYMHEPYAWPITDKIIKPLLISMHLDQLLEVFQTKESIEYFQKFSPVGARDLDTQKFLESKGVDSYFSGCVTLTLQKDPYIKKQDFILAVSIPEEVIEKIKSSTKRPVIRLDTDLELDPENRFRVAEKYLYLYQSAHCVVTTRLHCMLPCLALETPVLLINNWKGPTWKLNGDRYSGFFDLVYNLTAQEFIEGSSYDINKPPSNKIDYLKIRNKLIEQCEKYTGYNNSETFAQDIDFSQFNLEDCSDILISSADFDLRRKQREIDLRGSTMWHLRKDIENLEKKIEKVKKSNKSLNQEISKKEKELIKKNKEIASFLSIKRSARLLAGNIKRRILQGKNRK